MEKITQKYTLLSKELIYPGMFDLPKGVFMLYVLFYHSFYLFFPMGELLSSHDLVRRLVGVSMEMAGRGLIPLLFLCCGYSWRKRKMTKAVKGQMSSLIVPYAVTGAAVTIATILCGILWNESDIKKILPIVLPFVLGFCPGASIMGIYIGSVGALWCVVTFFFGGILLNLILQEKETWIQLSAVLLLACAGLLLSRQTMVFCFQQVLICTGYMYIGWLIKTTNFLAYEIRLHTIVLLALSGVGMGLFGCFDMSQLYFKNGMVDLISGLLVGLSLLVILLRLNVLEGKPFSFLRWMGRESFLICCVHSFWMCIPSTYVFFLMAPIWNSALPNAVKTAALFVFYSVTGVGGAYVCKKLKLISRRRIKINEDKK